MVSLFLVTIGALGFAGLQMKTAADSRLTTVETTAKLDKVTAAKAELDVRLATTQAASREKSDALAAERERAVASEQEAAASEQLTTKDIGTANDAVTAPVLLRHERMSLTTPMPIPMPGAWIILVIIENSVVESQSVPSQSACFALALQIASELRSLPIFAKELEGHVTIHCQTAGGRKA